MTDYNKYKNTVIYKICFEENCYVGSTVDFKRRKSEHKTNSKNENNKHYNQKLYTMMRDKGVNNFKFEILEYFPCETKLEKHERERYWYDQLKPNMNDDKPNRSKKEWTDEHKEHKKEYDKIYREKNKDKILENRKKYREENKEHVAKLKKESAQRCKETTQKWRDANRDKRHERDNSKWTCECGFIGSNANKYRHMKTQKHLDAIKQK